MNQDLTIIQDQIKFYLINEKKEQSPTVVNLLLEKVCKYSDIRDEFLRWLEKRDYESERPVTSGDHTAKEIFQLAPFLDGIGVYNFLVDLRDNPEQSSAYLQENLPIM